MPNGIGYHAPPAKGIGYHAPPTKGIGYHAPPTKSVGQIAAEAKQKAEEKARIEAERKKAEEKAKIEAERKEAERIRQEALRRAREARERLEKIKEIAEKKRAQILAKAKPPTKGIGYRAAAAKPPPIREVKPITITEPKPTTVVTVERENGIGISPGRAFPGVGLGAVAESLSKGAVIPVVEPAPEPTIPSVLPFDVTPFERMMITQGGTQAQVGIKIYEKRTGRKWGEYPEPEPEPPTFEEKLRGYGIVRQKILFGDEDDVKPRVGTIAERILLPPEEIAEAHMEKEIVSSLAENEVTPESIAEIARTYNDNLEELKDASKDSTWQFEERGKTYTQSDAVKHMEENTPEYVLKDVKGVGYSYAGKTIDLTKPGAFDEIVNFYTGSQEFVGGVLQDRAINQAYKATIKENPHLKDIIDRYEKIDPNKADELEYHLRKDIENQYSYTPTEPTADFVSNQLYQQMPESDRIAHDIKYTFPHEDTNPIDIIGVPGSYKYFSGVTGPKKTEIVGEIYDLYKKGKLPEIMGPGGLGFKRLLGKKISGVDIKKHNQQLRDYRKLLMNQGFGREVPIKEMVSFKGEKKQYLPGLSFEGERRLRDYEKKLNDERTKTVIWNTLTDPEYTEKVYEKMGTIPRVLYQMGEAAVTVAAIPITLPQAVIKLATGKTIGVDVGKGLESYRYGPKGVWTTLSQEAMAKVGIGAPVSEAERLQIKERPLEFFAASLSEAASFYGLGKATKLIHAPLAARGIKMPSMTGIARRGLRYTAKISKKEISRVFGPKLSVLGKPYWPTTIQQISRVPVGKWITHGRGLFGKEVSRRGLAYVTKTTKPFTKVITERVPRTLGKGFRERIVSDVTTPKPTLLGRAQMIGARREMGLMRTSAGDVGYRIGKETLKRQPSALRTGLSRGLEQFRYDWRLPTREGYRAFVGEPIARRGLGTTLETGYRRLVGLERKVGRAAKEEVTTVIAEKPGVLGTQKGTFIKTVYKRAGGSKWISEKEYNKIAEMFSKKGVKKIGEAKSIKLGDKYYYQDAAGNITETTKAVATSPDVKEILAAVTEQETLKKAAILKPVKPSLRTTMKVFRRETAGGFPLAEQMRLPSALREAGRFGRDVMKRLEKTPTITRMGGISDVPYAIAKQPIRRDIFTTGFRVGRERVGALKGRLAKRAVVKEAVETRIKPYTYTTPRGGQYYIGRLRPTAEAITRGVKREVSDFYFPTTPGGEALGLAGRGLGFTGLGTGLGIGYRRELDTTEVTDIDKAERRLPGIIQEVEGKQVVTPVAITERMPAREQLRGMLPWQVQPQISAMLPMTVQRQEPGFIQEQVLQQQLVPIQPQVGMELELHKPKFPFSIEDEEMEERRRREMLQRQQRGIGYKEREYKVPDIWGVTKSRARIAPQQMFGPRTTTIAATERKQTTKPKTKKIQQPRQRATPYRPPTMKQKPRKKQPGKMFVDTSIWGMKSQ